MIAVKPVTISFFQYDESIQPVPTHEFI
jgi:hypothetical protein